MLGSLFLFEEFRIKFFRAIRANSMTELCF